MTQKILSRLSCKNASPLAFGVMQFGGKADEAESAALYKAARAAGITIFDAAYIYTEGRAEELLGQFSAAEREDLILISKCAYKLDLSAEDIRAQVETSLARLRTEYVDILYLHRYPGDDALEEVLGEMRALFEAGAFRLLGASNFAAWEVMKAQAVARAIGAPPITVLQPMYSAVKRQAEVEILPMAGREGLAVLPYSPLGGGLLSGKYGQGGTGRLTEDSRYAARYAPSFMAEAAAGLAAIAAEEGVAPATLAVAWAAAHPSVSAPIISASRADQIGASLAAADFEMGEALYARLAALCPAPPPATDRLEEA